MRGGGDILKYHIHYPGPMFRNACDETKEAWDSFGKIGFPILICLGLLCLVDSALRCIFDNSTPFPPFNFAYHAKVYIVITYNSTEEI